MKSTDPEFPQLRRFEDGDSYAFAVGAMIAKLENLHDFAISHAEKPGVSIKSYKTALANIAGEIAEHIVWLNAQTAEREAEAAKRLAKGFA